MLHTDIQTYRHMYIQTLQQAGPNRGAFAPNGKETATEAQVGSRLEEGDGVLYDFF